MNAVRLQAPAVLLMGPPGSGKTYSISTLLELGLKVFVVCTEPTGLESLIDACEEKGLDLTNLHYKAITPSRKGFGDLQKMVSKLTVMNYDGLAKERPQGDRSQAKFIEVLKTLSDFKCDRTGESYGPVDEFGPDCALVIDSLSGISVMAMDLTIGDKLTAHQGEWGIAMNCIDRFILSLTSNLKCLTVLTAHIEREQDEITGAQRVMVSTLGRKLAPKLPRFFSELVLTYREGDSFFWSTTANNADLKKRALPLSNKLEPTFKPIVEAYTRRLEQEKAA